MHCLNIREAASTNVMEGYVYRVYTAIKSIKPSNESTGTR